MPFQTQISRWELFEFLARIGENYNCLMNSLMSDKEYNEWLQSRVDDTASIGDTSTIAMEFGDMGDVASGKEVDSTKANWTSSSPSGNSTTLLDQKYHYINIHSTANGEWYGAIATLDTGSDESWISQELADRLRLDVHKGLVTKWKTFNGETFASDSMVRATWSSHGRGVSHSNIFRVVPNAMFDILFGRNLILSGEVGLSGTNSQPGSVLVVVKRCKCKGKCKCPVQNDSNEVREAEAKRQHEENEAKWDAKDVKDTGSKTSKDSKPSQAQQGQSGNKGQGTKS